MPVSLEKFASIGANSWQYGQSLRKKKYSMLVAANRIKEAGEVAEKSLGRSAMGKNARLPFAHRPGPQMPPTMHEIGRGGHFAASEFAAAAASGNRERALALLPNLTASCVGCHAAYRSR